MKDSIHTSIPTFPEYTQIVDLTSKKKLALPIWKSCVPRCAWTWVVLARAAVKCEKSRLEAFYPLRNGQTRKKWAIEIEIEIEI